MISNRLKSQIDECEKSERSGESPLFGEDDLHSKPDSYAGIGSRKLEPKPYHQTFGYNTVVSSVYLMIYDFRFQMVMSSSLSHQWGKGMVSCSV